ncbi:hypothetical protein [Amycolatopsis sp. cmx-4-83]|uniref:hypothetical protein n=1 Tax=Amycolatopsis sp. cmx-4-83 TaxID=2790940 RepID=UPI00397E6E6E
MVVPYNLLPIELHRDMVQAEQAKVPVLLDAAKMWTECREWIDAASTELNTRAGRLTPEWQDDAGRAHEEKTQRSLAELKMWGERIDAARPAETLTTLASSISDALAEVMTCYAAYCAADLNPLTAIPAKIAAQQASAFRMNALGAQFDVSMLKVVAASGMQSPGDLMPTPKAAAEGNSPADFVKAAEAGMSALTELEGLAESAGVGSGGGTGGDSPLPGLPGLGQDVSSGLSLAGLSPATALPLSGAALGGLPGGGGAAPVASALPGMFGAAGGLGAIPTLAKPVAGKRAPSLASEVRPGTATPASAKPAGSSMPPMMPPHGGSGAAAGTLRPGSPEQPTGRGGAGRRAAAATDGVPAKLRGRSANGSPDAGFTLPRGRRTGETDADSVQLLDEELWQPGR